MRHLSMRIITSALLLTMLATLIVVPQGRAQGIIQGDNVPAGQTVEHNIILVGDNVTVDGNVDGDVIAIGSDIIINGDISGSLVTAGQTVIVNGAVDGSIYAASLSVELGAESALGRDLIYIGGQLLTDPASEIGRDLYALSLGATLGGTVSRDIRAIIGPLEIVNAILQVTQGKMLRDILPSRSGTNLSGIPVAAQFTNPATPSRQAISSWKHPQYSTAGINLMLTSVLIENLGEAFHPQQVEPQASRIDTERVVDWLLARLRALVTYLVFGVLAMLVFPRWFEPWVRKVRSEPLASSAWGLVVLVFGFSAAFLLGLLILPIVIFLFTLTLTDLGLSLLALGYFSLGLAFTIFLVFVVYISKVIIAYLVGRLILDRWAPQAWRSRFLALLLGVFIYILVVSIPILGWVIGLISSLLGLGAVWMVTKEQRLAGEDAPSPSTDEFKEQPDE